MSSLEAKWQFDEVPRACALLSETFEGYQRGTSAVGHARQVLLQPHDNKISRGPTNDVIADSSQASRDHAVVMSSKPS